MMGFTADAPAAAMSFTGTDPANMADAAAPVDAFSSVPVASTPMEDPFAGMPTGGGKAVPETSPLREWEKTHARELEDIASQESATKNETRKTAEAELGKWHEERKDTIQKKASTNRKDEQAVIENREAASKPGANPWERVVDLIDTNARTADESRDTSRMRALLIQLKSNPVVVAA